LRVWRGREGRVLEKKEGASGRNKRNWEGRALGGLFFFIIPNHPHLGELKNCIGGGFFGVFGGFIRILQI